MKRRSLVARCAAPIGALPALFVSVVCCQPAPVPPPVDPAVVEAQEERLLTPFAAVRTIVAARMSVEMTANFYDDLSRPAVIAGMQEEERTELPDGGTEIVYRNRSQVPLRFQISGTDFRILREARVTVLGGRSDLALQVEAGGGVNVIEDGARTDFQEVQFEGGQMVTRS